VAPRLLLLLIDHLRLVAAAELHDFEAGFVDLVFLQALELQFQLEEQALQLFREECDDVIWYGLDAQRHPERGNRFPLFIYPVDALDGFQVLNAAAGWTVVEVVDDHVLIFLARDGDDRAEAGELAGVVVAVEGVEDHYPAQGALEAFVARAGAGIVAFASVLAA